MRIKFEDLVTKEPFFVNAVPFLNIVYKDSLNWSDKTWKRYRGWSSWFTKFCATTINEERITRGKVTIPGCPYVFNAEEGYHLVVTSYYIFGHLVRVEKWISNTDWKVVESSGYIILNDTGVLFQYKGGVFQVPGGYDDDDWKIISELSGQAERRKMRIGLGGTTLMIGLSQLGFRIPRKDLGVVIPLMEEDFKPTERGSFIVTSFGKYIITDTNKSGFYRVIKEKQNVRFAELIEEYHKIQEGER